TMTAGTHRPNRRCSPIKAGARATTIMYTPRNHSGPNGIVAPGGLTPRRRVVSPHSVGPAGFPMSATCRKTRITVQPARHTRGGLRSRAPRSFTNDHDDPPRRSCAWNVTMLENPPTKKKIGMTWNTHVPSHRYDVPPTALVW